MKVIRNGTTRSVFALAVIALLVVGAVLWRRHRAETPRVDPSTPMRQAGFELVEVQAVPPGDLCRLGTKRQHGVLTRLLGTGSDDGPSLATATGNYGTESSIGLWIRPDDVPQRVAGPTPDNPYQAFVRAPTGEEMPAWSQLVMASDEYQPYLLHVRPAGRWPDSFRYLDVIVRNHAGREARWRITNLPRSVHAIPDGTKPKPTATVHGVTFTGRAWWGVSRFRGASWVDEVRLDVSAAGSPTGTGRWEAQFQNAEMEWEPAGGPATQGTSTIQLSGTVSGPIYGASQAGGYRGQQRLVRLRGKLMQYEAIDEPVTFRNLAWARTNGGAQLELASAQSATTPSGITVTLPSQKDAGCRVWGNISMDVQYPPTVSAADLRRSPLASRHRGDFTVSIQSAGAPFTYSGESRSADTRTISVRPIPSNGAPIPALTLIVRHRAEVAEYPFELIIPVENEPPPGKPRW